MEDLLLLADLLERVIPPSRIRQLRAVFNGDFLHFRAVLYKALKARNFAKLDCDAQVECLNATIRSLLAN